MANKKTEKKSDGGATEVDWDDRRIHDALENKQPLPDGIKIRSPYGRNQVDLGTMGIVGDDSASGGAGGGATGDDGNTGSSRGGATRGGADDS